ncbi:unnamed protein product [Schistosoma haematobium]|nr:unnamed protein product [Schistosoma haematobium]
MFSDEIRVQHPEVIIFKVPEKRGKAELTRYRDASSEVIQCISEFTSDIERASIDEAYVDLTGIVDSVLVQDDNLSSLQPNPESYVLVSSDIAEESKLELTKTNCVSLNGVDWIQLLDSNFAEGRRLAVASELVYRIRQAVFTKTGFRCSAGIGPNKSIAKLACSLNKPNKQTIIPHESIPILLENTHISKIRNLGGKLGSAVVKQLKIETLGQLSSIPLSVLTKEFGEKTSKWLHDLSHGIDHEVVTTRSLPKSVGCSKNFLGRATLTSSEQIKRWLLCLAEEIFERLDVDYHQHQRYPTRLILYARTTNDPGYIGGISRTLPSNLLQFIGYGNRSIMNNDDGNCSNTSDLDNKLLKYTSQIEKLANTALVILKEVLFKGEAPEIWDPGINSLGLSAGKFLSNSSTSNADIRSLLQKKQIESIKYDTVVQQESMVSIPPEKSTSPSLVKLSSDNDVKNDTVNISPDRKRNSNDSTVNINTNNLSFFKRLRVAEISAPFHPTPLIDNLNISNNTTTNDNNTSENKNFLLVENQSGKLISNPITPPPSTTTNVQLHQSLEQNKSSTLDDSPYLEVDSESRHSTSTTSDSSNFFKSYSIGDWIICDKCNSRISIWQLPEHEDFHIAQRIQHEWSNKEVNINTSLTNTIITKSNDTTNSNQVNNSLINKISSNQKSTKIKSNLKQSKSITKHQKSIKSNSGSLDQYFHKIP